MRLSNGSRRRAHNRNAAGLTVKVHHGTTRSFTENCKQCVSYYKNIKLERRLRADLLVENKVIKNITNQDKAQLIDYFKTTRLRKDLLIIQCNSMKIRGELLRLT